jgi:hypothetical protein
VVTMSGLATAESVEKRGQSRGWIHPSIQACGPPFAKLRTGSRRIQATPRLPNPAQERALVLFHTLRWGGTGYLTDVKNWAIIRVNIQRPSGSEKKR